jgi:DNA-binding MarR family transcriptional regulator
MEVNIINYYLWMLLCQTRDAVSKARSKELRRHNISSQHAAVLFIVLQLGHKATPAEIARWLFREPHSISELIDRMEKQGLVKKIKDLHRKNQVRVELTEKGLRSYYNHSIFPGCIPQIISVLSEEERHQLISNLFKLRNTAAKYIGIHKKFPVPPEDGPLV